MTHNLIVSLPAYCASLSAAVVVGVGTAHTVRRYRSKRAAIELIHLASGWGVLIGIAIGAAGGDAGGNIVFASGGCCFVADCALLVARSLGRHQQRVRRGHNPDAP